MHRVPCAVCRVPCPTVPAEPDLRSTLQSIPTLRVVDFGKGKRIGKTEALFIGHLLSCKTVCLERVRIHGNPSLRRNNNNKELTNCVIEGLTQCASVQDVTIHWDIGPAGGKTQSQVIKTNWRKTWIWC